MWFRWMVGVVAVLVLWTAPLSAAEPANTPDLSKVSRKIGRQPEYVSPQPLYGLYVFGAEARTEVWAVLDKSAADKSEYDVLYFDRNADGDLTGAAERILGTSGERSSGVKFHVSLDTDDPPRFKINQVCQLRSRHAKQQSLSSNSST